MQPAALTPIDAADRPADADASAIRLAVSTVVFAVRPDAEGVPRLVVPLVPRVRQPHLDRWALPGGWLPPDRGLEDTAARTVREATGRAPVLLGQLATFGDVGRSPSGRVVSVVHWALLGPEPSEQARPGWNVRWHRPDHPPRMAFDHTQILAQALAWLRSRLEPDRLAPALLKEEFTLAELRAVHEAVLGHPLDPANFRRAALAPGLLVDTGRVRPGTAHRPPRLYRRHPEPLRGASA